jgi:sorting nexin-29
MECSNYRGVSLLNTAYKMLSNILFTRISPFAKNLIGNYQCGFRKNRSTTNQIFTLRQILEKAKEFGIETHHLFIDFKSAYDTIRREQLYNVMSEFNIPKNL